MDNFAAVCHIMNENVYLNCLDPKLEQLSALSWLFGVCLAFWCREGKNALCSHARNLERLDACFCLTWTLSKPSVFTADSFYVTPPVLLLTPVWGISPQHQNFGCHHTHTRITSDTLVGFCCPSPGHSTWHWMPHQIVFKVSYAYVSVAVCVGR